MEREPEKLGAAGAPGGMLALCRLPSLPRPRGTRQGCGRTVGVALADSPGETTKVLLFVPFFFFFSFPSHIRVLFAKPEKEDTSLQEITALLLSKFQKYTACYFSPVTWVLWEKAQEENETEL